MLQVSGDDDAKYTVKAVNILGEATCTAELLVEVMAEEEEEEEWSSSWRDSAWTGWSLLFLSFMLTF